MTVGRAYAPEWHNDRDPFTGRQVRRLTGSSAEDCHLYLYNPSARAYAHYNLHPDGRTLVTDREARPGCISKVNLREESQIFEVLCRHDSYTFGDDQRCHPHPSFTPDGRQVIFTSNRTGASNVYLTDWDGEP